MVKAIIKFINKAPEVEKSIADAVDRAVKKSAFVMERNIKVNTPVLEGHLRRSIQAVNSLPKGEGAVENKAAEGGRDINYAVYVEYGTKYMSPRAMFRKGVKASEPKIKQLFKDELGLVESPSISVEPGF